MFSTFWAGILLFECVKSPMVFQNGKKDENQLGRQLEREQILMFQPGQYVFHLFSKHIAFHLFEFTYGLSKWQKDWKSIRKATGNWANLNAFTCPKCFPPFEKAYFFSPEWIHLWSFKMAKRMKINQLGSWKERKFQCFHLPKTFSTFWLLSRHISFHLSEFTYDLSK